MLVLGKRDRQTERDRERQREERDRERPTFQGPQEEKLLHVVHHSRLLAVSAQRVQKLGHHLVQVRHVLLEVAMAEEGLVQNAARPPPFLPVPAV